MERAGRSIAEVDTGALARSSLIASGHLRSALQIVA